MAANAIGAMAGESFLRTLQQAREELDTAEGEVMLDFSSVRRIDPDAVMALEALATTAQEKAIRLVLRGVNIDVYKVLKLVRLAPRLTFLS